MIFSDCKKIQKKPIKIDKYDQCLEIPPLSGQSTVFSSSSDLKIYNSIILYMVIFFDWNKPEKLVKITRIVHYPKFHHFGRNYFFYSFRNPENIAFYIFTRSHIIWWNNPEKPLNLAKIGLYLKIRPFSDQNNTSSSFSDPPNIKLNYSYPYFYFFFIIFIFLLTFFSWKKARKTGKNG